MGPDSSPKPHGQIRGGQRSPRPQLSDPAQEPSHDLQELDSAQGARRASFREDHPDDTAPGESLPPGAGEGRTYPVGVFGEIKISINFKLLLFPRSGVPVKKAWQDEIPSAVRCLENSLEACLTHLQFPEKQWGCLRRTNIIERLNKELKRRAKPMEIVASEKAAYTLLAFVGLKRETRWRSKSVGKVAANLPFMRRSAGRDFTEKS